MRTLVFLSLLALAFSYYGGDSPNATWIGKFQTILPCSDNCCCPQANQTYYFAPFNNTVHVIGSFESNSVCKNLGLGTASSTTTYPFGQYDSMSNSPVTGLKGQIFNNWFIEADYPFVEPNGQVINITLATIEINQTAIGGDDSCFFRMVKLGIVEW